MVVHRQPESSRVMTFLLLRSEFLAHAVDQMNFRAYGEHADPGRRVCDHLDQAFGGADAIGFLANFPAAFRMHNHLDAGILGANVVHMLGQKALMHRAMSLPQNHFRCAQAFRQSDPPLIR